jgi:hypothetical protein
VVYSVAFLNLSLDEISPSTTDDQQTSNRNERCTEQKGGINKDHALETGQSQRGYR